MGLFFQAEDGIRDLVRSRGLGDVYKRQLRFNGADHLAGSGASVDATLNLLLGELLVGLADGCLLYTSDAADDPPCVDFGGRRILKKKNTHVTLIISLSLP